MKTNLLMAGAMLAIGILNVLFAEKLPVRNGFGWDGVIYGRITYNFDDAVFSNWLDGYRIQRILPCGIVHYGMRAVGIPLGDESPSQGFRGYKARVAAGVPAEGRPIFRGFEVYNSLVLVLSAFIWGLIADRLGIQSQSKWLGFFSLFVNFCVLKHIFYCPVTTDSTGFAFGLLLIYFYLTSRSTGVLLVTIAGSFGWPTVLYQGLLLFLFPRTSVRSTPMPWHLNIVLATTISGLAVAGAAYVYYSLEFYRPGATYLPSLINLSLIALGAYLFLALSPLLNYSLLLNPKHIFTWRRLTKFVVVVMVFFLVRSVQSWLSNGEAGWMTPERWVKSTLSVSIKKPFLFGVAHVLYYGPIVLLAFFVWGRFCLLAQKHGLGLLLVLLIGVMMSITCESRMVINFFPVFAVFLIEAVAQLNLNMRFYLFFSVVSFLASKVWMTVNTQPLSLHKDSYLEFPWQKWRGSIGSWMSDSMYVAQGGIILLMAVVLYFAFLHGRINPSTNRNET